MTVRSRNIHLMATMLLVRCHQAPAEMLGRSRMAQSVRRVPPTAAFASCPPPRFDTFSDRVVGKWTRSDGKIEEVEEVMRSCGGAVQGIKELGVLFPNCQEKPYHNRADDGFVYFDCGCYDSGPVKVQPGSKTGILSSLIFPSFSPKKRALVSTEIVSEDKVGPCQNSRCTVLERTPWGAEDSEAGAVAEVIVPCDDAPSYVEWNREVACRMPSSSQPWMLQRVKWEEFVNSNVADEDRDTNGDLAPDGWSIKGWASATTSKKLWGHEELNFLSSYLGEDEWDACTDRGIVSEYGRSAGNLAGIW